MKLISTSCDECGTPVERDLLPGEVAMNRALYGDDQNEWYLTCRAHLGILGDLLGMAAEMPEFDRYVTTIET